ncbi:MAG: transcriptional regulator with XRE-family HTH domain [Crocinitomicaceae bacterium]|jgi:transcriptional regulator with XRE-family HTH domain
MNHTLINLRDFKKMRLECHWSQDQLAEISGLSIRTIQRIENGENTGLESLKYLTAVFETNIADFDKKVAQIRKEEEYAQNVKGFYKLLAVALISLVVPFILAVSDTSDWNVFLLILLSWGVLLVIYSLNVFDFFGDKWKRKLIKSRFKKE